MQPLRLFLDEPPQLDCFEDPLALLRSRSVGWVEVCAEGRAVRKKDRVLGDGDEALAEGRAVDAVQRNVVNQDRRFMVMIVAG